MRGEWFYMRRSDRRMVLALLTVAVVALMAGWLAGGRDESQGEAKGVVAEADTLPSSGQPLSKAYYRQEEQAQAERFFFDPNTADSTQLLRLGLQPWQVRNIYKYRAHGGIYRSKADFARLYGLTVGQYRELEPYIVIGADYQPASTLVGSHSVEHWDKVHTDTAADALPRRYPLKLAEGEQIDLALADTALLQRVPGIGPYYARQIVEYRNRLGGFVSLNQLDEIDHFPQEAKAYLLLDGSEVEKLSINELSLNDLKRHPYINYYQARAIVDHRRLHGPIVSLDDLRLLPDFTSEAIERLRPYIAY